MLIAIVGILAFTIGFLAGHTSASATIKSTFEGLHRHLEMEVDGVLDTLLAVEKRLTGAKTTQSPAPAILVAGSDDRAPATGTSTVGAQ